MNECKSLISFRTYFSGYGVFATTNIEPGEFLLEYVGGRISGLEGEALFKKYSDADAAFLYFYSFQGQTFW